MREYGNCGSGYVYNDTRPDLPRSGTEGAPRPRTLQPSPIVLLDPMPRMARPKTVTRANPKPKPRPRWQPQTTSPDMAAEIVRRYQAGESARSIRAALGVGYDRVNTALRNSGITPTKARRRAGQDWPCNSCGRQMRPWNSDKSKWPKGSIVHAGHGRCASCKNREPKKETAA